jgi:excisionase family DNA binding protein
MTSDELAALALLIDGIVERRVSERLATLAALRDSPAAVEAPGRPPGALMTAREAAAMLGINPQTLNAWRSTKAVDLPYVKLGRAVRYRREDIEAYIRARTVME